MGKRGVTVFDFDGTLTSEDTFISFSRFALGNIKFLKGLLLASPWLIKWKLGRIPGSDAKMKLYSFLYKGREKEAVKSRAKDFAPDYNEEVLNALKECKKRGDKVYIITASLDLWMEEIARKLEVNLLCTSTSVNAEGNLDGSFSSPNCHGEEKLRRLIDAEGDRKDFFLTVYGDEPSGGDSALFLEADKAIKV